MIKTVLIVSALAAAGFGAWMILAPGSKSPDQASPEMGAPLAVVTVPDRLSPEAAMGKKAYETVCVDCHGDNGSGRNGMGPPLVHKIYEPSHHGDESFQRAVALGVRAHHWRFGDMAPVEGFTRADVKTIIAYMRELQRANGIH